MVKYFKKVLGTEGEVHVCNSDDKSIAFKYADRAFIAPLIYDDKYIPFLVDYCKKNEISIVVSLFDMDLLILARNKEKFENNGTRVIVSDPKIIEICNDKWKTYQFLNERGFYTPKTHLYLDEVINELEQKRINYPIIVKPRFGCGSISVSIAYDEEDLRYLAKKAQKEIDNSYLKYESAFTREKIIFQEKLSGQEYGADIINNLQGNNINVVVRKKIAMRSGETDIAEIADIPIIKNTLKKLGTVTGHIANMDCDIFLVGDKPYILEMNARFGGGYPFSHMAGCNLPQAIVDWVAGKAIDVDLVSAQVGIMGFKEICITDYVQNEKNQ